MAPGRFETMLKAVTGFELRIEALRGTRKLGQIKPPEERTAAAEAVAPFNPAMAALMHPEAKDTP
jgi:predicted FMN-binding regulatory protein PaiB